MTTRYNGCNDKGTAKTQTDLASGYATPTLACDRTFPNHTNIDKTIISDCGGKYYASSGSSHTSKAWITDNNNCKRHGSTCLYNNSKVGPWCSKSEIKHETTYVVGNAPHCSKQAIKCPPQTPQPTPQPIPFTCEPPPFLNTCLTKQNAVMLQQKMCQGIKKLLQMWYNTYQGTYGVSVCTQIASPTSICVWVNIFIQKIIDDNKCNNIIRLISSPSPSQYDIFSKSNEQIQTFWLNKIILETFKVVSVYDTSNPTHCNANSEYSIYKSVYTSMGDNSELFIIANFIYNELCGIPNPT